MKKILIAVIPCLFTSCQPSQFERQNALKRKAYPALVAYYNGMFNTYVVDSINIVKIDTLTPKKLEIEKIKDYAILINQQTEDIKKIAQQAKYPGSNFDELKEKGRNIINQINVFDTLRKICITKYQIADSTSFINYIALVNVRLVGKNMVEHDLDSAHVILTKDFKIKEIKDYTNSEILAFLAK